jgi:hypothetical protein
MCVGSPYEHKGHVGADVAGRVYHVSVMFIGEPTNIRPMWHQGHHGPMWHQGHHGPMWHTFVGQVELMNVRVLGSADPPGR